jgi:flagellar secretion chaperone FliS
MSPAANDEYLTTEVMTASPQKLQLMLIDAAIRAANRAQSLWTRERTYEVSRAIRHCQSIVAQILAGLAPNHESPLVQRIIPVYEFLHRTLLAAYTQQDRNKLANVIEVLEVERETWQQVCEQLDLRFDAAQPELTGPHADMAAAAESQAEFATGISFEA